LKVNDLELSLERQRNKKEDKLKVLLQDDHSKAPRDHRLKSFSGDNAEFSGTLTSLDGTAEIPNQRHGRSTKRSQYKSTTKSRTKSRKKSVKAVAVTKTPKHQHTLKENS
jgi:hypothetical protein